MRIMIMLRGITNKLMRLTKKTGKVYWISVEKIKVPQEFSMTPPHPKKMEYKWTYYGKTGKLQSPILLTRDYVLVDGYTSYIIACETDMGVIPVQFVDETMESVKNGD